MLSSENLQRPQTVSLLPYQHNKPNPINYEIENLLSEEYSRALQEEYELKYYSINSTDAVESLESLEKLIELKLEKYANFGIVSGGGGERERDGSFGERSKDEKTDVGLETEDITEREKSRITLYSSPSNSYLVPDENDDLSESESETSIEEPNPLLVSYFPALKQSNNSVGSLNDRVEEKNEDIVAVDLTPKARRVSLRANMEDEMKKYKELEEEVFRYKLEKDLIKKEREEIAKMKLELEEEKKQVQRDKTQVTKQNEIEWKKIRAEQDKLQKAVSELLPDKRERQAMRVLEISNKELTDKISRMQKSHDLEIYRLKNIIKDTKQRVKELEEEVAVYEAERVLYQSRKSESTERTINSSNTKTPVPRKSSIPRSTTPTTTLQRSQSKSPSLNAPPAMTRSESQSQRPTFSLNFAKGSSLTLPKTKKPMWKVVEADIQHSNEVSRRRSTPIMKETMTLNNVGSSVSSNKINNKIPEVVEVEYDIDAEMNRKKLSAKSFEPIKSTHHVERQPKIPQPANDIKKEIEWELNDGSIIRRYSDERVERKHPDGRMCTLWNDGNKSLIVRKQYGWNYDPKTKISRLIDTTETGCTIYFYSDENSLTTLGRRVIQVVQHFNDGSKRIYDMGKRSIRVIDTYGQEQKILDRCPTRTKFEELVMREREIEESWCVFDLYVSARDIMTEKSGWKNDVKHNSYVNQHGKPGFTHSLNGNVMDESDMEQTEAGYIEEVSITSD